MDRTGPEHEDSLVLHRVLDELYDFDDSASKKKSKSRKKKKREEERVEEGEELPMAKVIRRVEPVDTEVQEEEPNLDHTGPAASSGRSSQVEVDRSSGRSSQVEVVTFLDPSKRRSIKTPPAADIQPSLQVPEKNRSLQPEELSLEKARLEVHRFGISGFRKEQQRLFEQDRAVMLGARPPKKDYVNYKLLQTQIKQKKQEAQDEAQGELKKKKKKKMKDQQDKKKKKVSSGSGPSGQVGRFKDGMLILSSKEIQTLRGKIRAK